MISCPIFRYCCPGSKAHIVFSAQTMSNPVPRHHRCVSRSKHKNLGRKHTSLQLYDFIAGTGTSPYVLSSVAAVVILRTLVATNYDELIMINTRGGLAVAVRVGGVGCMRAFCIAPRVRSVCGLCFLCLIAAGV